MELEYFTGSGLPSILPIFYFDKRQRYTSKRELILPHQPTKVVRIEFRKLAKDGYNIWLEDGSYFFDVQLYELLVHKKSQDL